LAVPDVGESDPEGARQAYESGNTLFAQGDYEGAIRAYTEAISRDASQFRAYNNRALAYMLTDRPDEAVSDLERALAASHDDPEILFNLGNVHLRRGFNPLAAEAFQRAVERNPSDLEAKNNLAVALARMEEFDRAEQLLGEVVAQAPDDLAALANLAAVYDAQEDTQRALETYQRALDVDPNHFPTLRNLGILEAREGLLESARNHLEAALNVAPPESDTVMIETTLNALGQ
jgi:tetratricopeptide (TPR) repeat protein